jgi:hypothetical protein
VDDAMVMAQEAHRILKKGGCFIIGFIDRTSPLGEHYLSHQYENPFYRDATFYSATEVESLLNKARFGEQTWVQTLSKPPHEIRAIEPTYPGRGMGSFVVVRANKP